MTTTMFTYLLKGRQIMVIIIGNRIDKLPLIMSVALSNLQPTHPKDGVSWKNGVFVEVVTKP